MKNSKERNIWKAYVLRKNSQAFINILEFSLQNNACYGGFYHCQVMYWFFIYPRKILDNGSPPRINSPGLLLVDLPTANKQNQRLVPKTLSIFPRSIFPLKNFTLPDGLTTRWHVDCSVTCDGNLERIDAENICPWHKLQHVYTQNRWFSGTFSRAHGSFNLKKICLNWKFSVTVSSKKGTKKQIRYRLQLVIIDLFPNEIISSTIVYDQDANRSRGLY